MSDCIIFTMDLRRCYPFLIAAATLVYQASPLNAQTTRATQPDSDITITSLTNLNHSRRGSTSLGRVDLSIIDEVNLGLSGGPGLVNSDGIIELSGSRGGAPRWAPSSARFSQSRNLPNAAGSRIYSASSLRIPLSKTTVIQRTSDLQSRIMGLNAVTGKPKSSYDAREFEKASRMKTLMNNSSGTGAIQSAESPFERLTDPFSGLFNENLEGFNKNLHMEQPCGDACRLGSAGQSFDSLTPETGHSAERRYSHKLRSKD
jgi:hypothetical protein